MYEFRLKYAKTTQSGHFGLTCTGTPWTCTGTCCIQLACTGTCWPLVGCTGTPLYLYQYMLGKLSRFASFATFDTNSPYITSPFLNSSKIIMEIIQTTSKYLYWWFETSYHKTLGKNPMKSPKGPSILLNII